MADSGVYTSMHREDFDEAYDVVVVGYGFSGAIAAIEAADAGAKVLLVEKAQVPGGISICSYGAVRSAMKADDALKYLKITNSGRTPDDVLTTLATGMSEMEAYVRTLAKASGAEVETTKEGGRIGGNYPFPGTKTFYTTAVVTVPNFDAAAMYPHVNGAPGGPKLFRVLEDNIGQRDVTVRLDTRVVRLLTDPGRQEVCGVVTQSDDGEIAIKARRGVILACGGFEGDAELREQYWENQPVLPVAARSNTGDGIRMAQDMGAALWHMWHFHGCYGFRHTDPDYPYAIRVKRLPDWIPDSGFVPRRDETTELSAAQVSMAWILLDRGGRRYGNEYHPYMQDTGHRPMGAFDPMTQCFDRNPSFLVCDDNGRRLYPLGRPTSNDPDVDYEWSDDNMKEVSLGILKTADTLAGLAEALGLDAAAVTESVERWNALCRKGADEDFGRPPGTMVPVSEPPFFGAPVWSVVSNTQGGPVRDTRQRIVRATGEPIPRLYAVGEMGSAFGHLYLSGGNIAECFISGRIAGAEAAGLASRD